MTADGIVHAPLKIIVKAYRLSLSVLAAQGIKSREGGVSDEIIFCRAHLNEGHPFGASTRCRSVSYGRTPYINNVSQ